MITFVYHKTRTATCPRFFRFFKIIKNLIIMIIILFSSKNCTIFHGKIVCTHTNRVQRLLNKN